MSALGYVSTNSRGDKTISVNVRRQEGLLTFATVCLFAVPSPCLADNVERPLNYGAIGAFLVFVAITLWITWWAARRTRTTQDFYAAGNRITGVQNGFAIAGDFMSAASLLGTAGLVVLIGYDAIYFQIGLTVGWVVVLMLVAERLRNLGQYTFADVVSLRLARRSIRILAACGTVAVAIPYLIAQLVAAGALVEALFGLSYAKGVLVVGVLMTIYVSFGGMIATTWVQIVKAVLLLCGATILFFMVLIVVDFDLKALALQAMQVHPNHSAIMQPGLLFTSPISVLSVSLAFIGGIAGMPHVLMRFFTVPDAREARRSAGIALLLITVFNWIILVIGLGAIALLVDHPQFTNGGTDIVGGSNMAVIYLAQLLGGDIFMGFISAVAFATILAVVSGLTLSCAASIAHDLYANVFRHGSSTEAGELQVSRVTIVVLGVIAVSLAILFQGQNVSVLATIPLAIAASSNFPVLILAMYWRRMTTRGALAGGYSGVAIAVILVILGPNVWVQALGFERAIFPYTYPTVFSMPAAFLIACWVSLRDRSEQAAAEALGFDKNLSRAQLGSVD